MLLAGQHPPVARALQRPCSRAAQWGTQRRCPCRHPTSSSDLLPGTLALSAYGRRRKSSSSSSQRWGRLVTRMGIRAVETYDSAFQLEPEAEAKLKELLRTPTFCAQVRPHGRRGLGALQSTGSQRFPHILSEPWGGFGQTVALSDGSADDSKTATIRQVQSTCLSVIWRPSQVLRALQGVTT